MSFKIYSLTRNYYRKDPINHTNRQMVVDKAHMKTPKLSSLKPRGYGMALSNLPILKKREKDFT